MNAPTNRDTLLRCAATLLRQKGYDGVGLAEILSASGLPKGSLYYHFPGGKRELATAATLCTGAAIQRLIDRAFADADSFATGAAALARAIAALIPPGGPVQACPVASILQASGQEPALRDAARQVMNDWAACLAAHATRLGHAAPQDAADLLLMQMEGAWLLALAEQSPRPLERLAALKT
ncbi:TetR/AcrR family transcriptional regulator [Actibacterium ureilyticum]|uniref:TetR/AcrR family transcriptional regulator n=1 Tax=Actibacterium ureilyticum TaxID=1590614 RepID=UPI000BAA9EAB|nr:TetR/AcrR family transcriptional regulator [Actibacterium ureilyticum]